jgi:hypothetical protein
MENRSKRSLKCNSLERKNANFPKSSGKKNPKNYYQLKQIIKTIVLMINETLEWVA